MLGFSAVSSISRGSPKYCQLGVETMTTCDVAGELRPDGIW